MNSPHHSSRPCAKSLCRKAREWITLILGAAAGITFLWLCLLGKIDPFSGALLLVLCFTMLGKKTGLMHLVQALSAIHSNRTRSDQESR